MNVIYYVNLYWIIYLAKNVNWKELIMLEILVLLLLLIHLIFRIKYHTWFLNYRDTNYELTYAYFFYPSRHSIDGERFDLEVNLYHGVWKESGEEKGMVVHSHYHEDSDQETSHSHKHFHYHLNSDTEDDNPCWWHRTRRNIITCILFNQGPHKGTRSNIFFNQFVHTEQFKTLLIQ